MQTMGLKLDVVCQALNGSDVFEHVNDDNNMFLDSDSGDVPFERLYDVIIHNPIDDIPIGSDYGSSDQLNSPNNSDDESHLIYPDFRATDLDDPVFTVGRGDDGESFQISSFESVHTCSRAFHGRAFSSRWLIGKVMEDHEVELSRSKAYRAKQYAKGAVAGQLLVVVRVDGNEGMYPIAYAVAEVESGETWTWFLKNLVSDIEWDLTGIPCKHVVRAISYKGHNTEDYVDDYFKKKTYMRVYSHLIQPCNGLDFWPIAVGDLVLPPIHRKQPGRPKRMHRRRDPNEHQNSHKLKWNQNSLRCGQCHQIGHNKRSCKKKQTMLAGVGKTEAKAKGRKNVASSDKGKGKKRACNLDVNFMGFRIPARVGQDETRAKGKKNMASTNTEESSMGFRVPIGMSSQHSNISGSPIAYNSSAPATSLEDTRSRNDIYGVQSSRDKQ
uniref:Zinc finger PMZ-type domain-containing protein n=1 Tax=Fagus sylvatica TaxID=28930 RepID=A0A2N9HPW4_FAGSY